MFLISPQVGCFRQGEILSNLIQLHVDASSLEDPEGPSFEEKTHPFALILTQDCDLDWDFKARTTEIREDTRQRKQLPNILFCELFEVETLKPQYVSNLWQRISRNQDERFHYITACHDQQDRKGTGLPVLVADFKRIFSIPTDELYKRVSSGLERRTTLSVPFLQDLANRFGCYLLRVALPSHDQLPPVIGPTATLLLEARPIAPKPQHE